MPIKVAVGKDNFEAVISNGSYYVDKTEIIYELVNDTDNMVTLFTRPRRFGKTMVMSMLESFFDITRDSRDVFRGLNITKNETFCKNWMNQYPVLFISFKDVDGETFEKAYGMLALTISRLCKKWITLLNDEHLISEDRDIFRRLTGQNGSQEDVKSALDTIMRMMNTAYGKPVILLIDEYDVPLSKASEKGYYTQMVDIIRSMISVALKTNEYLKFAVVTGCLRIAKESIFTGTNNFASYSVLDERFSGYFGFTQSEMNQMLHEAGVEEKAEVFQKWYDGYIFGNHCVYCPWDVVSYVSALLYNRDVQPKNYWRNTSGNGIIRDFVQRTDFDVTDKFEILMNGGTIHQTISDQLTYDTLHESEDNLWSVLLMTGYLTKADPKAEGDTVELKIPNAEIAGIFKDTVVQYFTDTLDKGRQHQLMQALWSGNAETASKICSDFLWETISYNDYHEDYYHAFLAGIFVGLAYAVESNKEKGLGRPDIQLKDKKHRRAIIIEAKRSVSKEKMEHDCDEAIRQIRERKYAEKLDDGYGQVLCYGISFFQKTALIKKL